MPSICTAQEHAAADDREIVFIASVCGTKNDPQDLARQETLLRDAGVLLADSNAAAARLALRTASRGEPVTWNKAKGNARKSL